MAALNGMLAVRELGASLRQGMVHLLLMVVGMPTATQDWPITHLCRGNKLLTKMLTTSLLVVLPSVLLSTWMYSVCGC
jgi:hypothetical protein